MEELKKSVKIGRTVYKVEAGEDYIRATEIVYPLPGYGNNYGTSYEIDLSYSKGWAKAEIYCWNNTWGCRGHGMTDSWTEATGYIRKGEARRLHDSIVQELQEAEDGTPDIRDIFDEIRAEVEEATSEDYED